MKPDAVLKVTVSFPVPVTVSVSCVALAIAPCWLIVRTAPTTVEETLLACSVALALIAVFNAAAIVDGLAPPDGAFVTVTGKP